MIGTRGELPREVVGTEDPSGRTKIDTSALSPTAAFEVFAGKAYMRPPGSAAQHEVTTAVSGSARSPPADPVSRFFRLKAELEDLGTACSELLDPPAMRGI